jgi:hypothetical protein
VPDIWAISALRGKRRPDLRLLGNDGSRANRGSAKAHRFCWLSLESLKLSDDISIQAEQTMNHLPLALCIALVPAVTHAEDLTYSGYVEAEMFFDGVDSTTYGFGGLDVSYRATGTLGWGVDLGLDVVGIEGNTIYAVTGGLVLNFGAGQLTIGNPRGPLETHLQFPDFGGSRITNLELGTLGSGLVYTARVLLDADVMGVRYDHDLGATDFAVAAYDVEGTTLFEAAVKHEAGNLVYVLGADIFEQRGTTNSIVTAAVTGTWGKIGAGLQGNFVSGRFGPGGGDSLHAYASYDVTDRFTVTAAAVSLSESKIGTLYALSANYDITPNLYVHGGLIAQGNRDTLYSLAFGAKF